MAFSLPSSCTLFKPSLKHNTIQALQVKAQAFRDEGRPSHIVDANMSVLKERIKHFKIKERLERCCRYENGWNYAPGYNYNIKKNSELSQFFELVGLVGGTIGFTCLSGTLFLCLASLLVHMNY